MARESDSSYHYPGVSIAPETDIAGQSKTHRLGKLTIQDYTDLAVILAANSMIGWNYSSQANKLREIIHEAALKKISI